MRLSAADRPSPSGTRPATPPAAARRAAHVALLAAVVSLLVVVLGCAPEAPRPSVSLLPLAGPVLSGPATADPAAGRDRSRRFSSRQFSGVPEPWPLDRPGRLRVGSSERLALVTTPEVTWEMPVALGAGDRLVLSAVQLGPAEGHRGEAGGEADGEAPPPAAGRLLLLDEDGDERTLAELAVGPGEWAEFELRVAEAGEGRLRLASVSGAVAWAGVLLVRDEPAPPARPNLVLVSVDTLRADRLAAYGAGRPVAPNLDRFAEGSLVFQRSLSTSTWTLPSHASMFTGQLPDQHGLVSLHDRLPADLPTVAGRLAEVGYHTVGITDGGFLHPRWSLAAGFHRWDWTEGDPWEPKDVRVVVERARTWLEANRFEPYFLFVHTYETHQPYSNREGFADPFLPTGDEGPDRLVVPGDLAVDPADPDQARRATALYDGGVARMDHHLGGWLLELAESGRLDGTAVVVTSDHGEELGEHGGYEHGAGKVYDENVRVPLLVRLPGGGDGGGETGAGRTGMVTTPVTSLDLAPTLLAWAGASDPSLPGRTLTALAAEPDPERPVLAHGVNSLPDLHERHYRLDRGDHTLLLDRVRSVLRSFDRGQDPGMEHPRTVAAPGETGQTPVAADTARGLARLQAVLAWAGVGGDAEGEAEGEGGGDRLAVALPPEAGAMEAGRGSAVVPRGVWDGASWRPLGEATGRVPLRPGLPALLTFDPRGGHRPRVLELSPGDGGTGEALALRGARWTEEPGWNPVDGRLPGPGEIFRTAGRGAAATLELDDEARRELRALGYLR